MDPKLINSLNVAFKSISKTDSHEETYILGKFLFKNRYLTQKNMSWFAVSAIRSNHRRDLLNLLLEKEKTDSLQAFEKGIIASMYFQLKDEQGNKKYALEYSKERPVLISKSDEKKLTVLVLHTAASGAFDFNIRTRSFQLREGHNNLASFFDKFIQRVTLRVDDLESAKKTLLSLGKVDVIYNAITDADRCVKALENAVFLCDMFAKIPVVNHPHLVLQTTRDNNYHRFHKNRYIIYPKNVKLSMVAGECHKLITQAITDNELSYPVIARLSGFQGGKNMHLIHSADEHDFADFDVAVKDSAKDIYLIEYTDVSFTDKRAPNVKLYPKYRAFMAGGKLYPIHLFVAADDFNVHLANSEKLMSANPWLQDMEKLYCSSPEKVIHRNLWRALEKTLRKADLDYIGVDFAIGKDKKGSEGVVIFETNAAMRNWMKDAHYTHERVAWEKVTRRMHHVFCDKAKVPAWNFYLPIDPK